MLFCAVLIVSIGLRVYRLDELPETLFFDEAYYGVDALRVLGGERPIFFTNNNGREPLYIYLQAISLAVLGIHPVVLRVTSVIIGLATIGAVFLAGRELHGNLTGYIAAFWLATSYWHVNLSRLGFRVVLLPLVTTLCVLCLARALRTGSRMGIIGSGFFLGLSLYTYNSARIFPLAFVAIVAGIWFGCRIKWGISPSRLIAVVVSSVAISVVVASPLLVYFARHPGQILQRGDQVFLGSDEDPRVWLEKLRPRELPENVAVTLGAFGIRGDSQVRHNLPDRPVFDPVTFILFCAGIAFALHPRTRSSGTASLAWLLIMCIPGAITTSPPHFLRISGALPPAMILVGTGATYLLEHVSARSRPWYILGLILLAFFTVMNTTRDYFFEWTRLPDRPTSFDIHADRAVDAFITSRGHGIPSFLVSIGEPHPLFRFRPVPQIKEGELSNDLPSAMAAVRALGKSAAIACFACIPPNMPIMEQPIVLVSGRTAPIGYASANELDGRIRFSGIEYAASPRVPGTKAGQAIAFWGHWRVFEPIGKRYIVSLTLSDSNGNVLAVSSDADAARLWPTTLWRPGDRYASTFRIPLSDELARQTVVQARIEMIEVPAPTNRDVVAASIDLGRITLIR